MAINCANTELAGFVWCCHWRRNTEFDDLVALTAQYFEPEIMERKALAGYRDDGGFIDHQSGNG